MKLQEYLKENRLITDGAMGTYYAALKGNDRLVSEFANINEPEFIEEIHMEYIKAGARLLRTNTFAASRDVLQVGAEEQENIIRAACRIAKNAVEKVTKENKQIESQPVFIAGDIGPIPYNPDRTKEDIIKEYKRICDIFIEEKLPVILFETFSDLIMIQEVIAYVKEKSDVFLITDFCVNHNGYSSMGIKASRLLEMAGKMEQIDAVGFNCGVGSGHMCQILKKMVFPKNKYIIAMPNAGYPEKFQNRMVFRDNADYFVENMLEAAELGLDIVGGCCGTTPAYIKKLAQSISQKTVLKAAAIEVVQEEQKEQKKPAIANAFYEKLKQGKKVVAVELDPPYDAKYESVIQHAQYLKEHNVDIITMADSPRGRSRVDSILMSVKLVHDVGVSVMPHVCCRDRNMIAMRSSLLGAYINDIRNLLIVTGDPVPSVSRSSISSVFDYNSIQLMNFMKEMNQEHFSDEPIYYGGALNYAGRIDKVVERMKKKADAGAAYFLTQPIYAPEDIERIHQIKERIDTKILCGIMPFTSFRNATFVKNELAGIHVPDEIVNRYHPDMSREEAEIVGAKIASEIMEKLYAFADGYYFMLPFNRVSFMDKITIQ
jgi:homocysteine S-methyltransferase